MHQEMPHLLFFGAYIRMLNTIYFYNMIKIILLRRWHWSWI